MTDGTLSIAKKSQSIINGTLSIGINWRSMIDG